MNRFQRRQYRQNIEGRRFNFNRPALWERLSLVKGSPITESEKSDIIAMVEKAGKQRGFSITSALVLDHFLLSATRSSANDRHFKKKVKSTVLKLDGFIVEGGKMYLVDGEITDERDITCADLDLVCRMGKTTLAFSHKYTSGEGGEQNLNAREIISLCQNAPPRGSNTHLILVYEGSCNRIDEVAAVVADFKDQYNITILDSTSECCGFLQGFARS
jgi:hypothetical protein